MNVTPARGTVASPGRLLAWTALVGTITLLNFAGNLFAEDEDSGEPLYRYSTAVLSGIAFAVMLAIVLWIAGRERRAVLALRRPRSWPSAIGAGVLLIIAVFVLVAALSPVLDPGEEQGLLPEKWNSDYAPQFALNALVVALVAPVVEELAYRGLGFSLLERFGRAWAIGVTGVAFALSHGLFEALPAFTAFGCGLAYMRYRFASVYPAIATHAAFNTMGLVVVLAR